MIQTQHWKITDSNAYTCNCSNGRTYHINTDTHIKPRSTVLGLFHV